MWQVLLIILETVKSQISPQNVASFIHISGDCYVASLTDNPGDYYVAS